MADPNTRDAKLIQYLNEAYGKEKELEVALEAHIAMTTRMPYKKRLREHLKETKAHGRAVERRIKQLGGKAEASPLPGGTPEVLGGAAAKVQEVASRGLSAAKGPLHMLRGTGEQEKMLKNAKTEYWNEFEEIATYYAIEKLAEAVGDTETTKLARGIRREEERMAKFLERQIPVLAKAVAQEEVPAAERRTARRRTARRRSSTGRGSGSRSTSSRSATARSGGSRSGAARTSAAARTSRSGGGRSGGRRARS
jgi:ferritin-like metal-binding protein YciE